MNKVAALSLFLIGCGGYDYAETVSEEERLIQFCASQNLDAQLLSVYNVDTGESYLDVKCIKPNEDITLCKPGAKC